MKSYKIKTKDLTYNYFHFTKFVNLKKIEKEGLIPKIGFNARYLEKTPKVFFVNNLDNLLILFDCWINAYKKLPLIPFVYTLGSRLIQYRWFPKSIGDMYFKFVSKNPHKRRAYKVFDQLLNECVLLNLNIEEGIDFNIKDKDEIKSKKYYKEHLIAMGYKEQYSNIESDVMDAWNMHTLSNHTITPEKIKLCYIDNSYKLKDILLYIIKNTSLDIEYLCQDLNDYLISRNLK